LSAILRGCDWRSFWRDTTSANVSTDLTEQEILPAGGAVGSLVEGAPSAGVVSVAAEVSALVVFFFLEKKAFNLSRGESGSTFVCQRALRAMMQSGVFGFNHTTHVDEEVE
jgi:hypothetical protein